MLSPKAGRSRSCNGGMSQSDQARPYQQPETPGTGILAHQPRKAICSCGGLATAGLAMAGDSCLGPLPRECPVVTAELFRFVNEIPCNRVLEARR
jgi:hypothetical protein